MEQLQTKNAFNSIVPGPAGDVSLAIPMDMNPNTGSQLIQRTWTGDQMATETYGDLRSCPDLTHRTHQELLHRAAPAEIGCTDGGNRGGTEVEAA